MLARICLMKKFVPRTSYNSLVLPKALVPRVRVFLVLGIQESPNDVLVWNMNGLYHQLVIFGYGHQSMFIGILSWPIQGFPR